MGKLAELVRQAMSVTNCISAGERHRQLSHWHGSPDTNIAQRGVHRIVHDHAGLIFIMMGKKNNICNMQTSRHDDVIPNFQKREWPLFVQKWFG